MKSSFILLIFFLSGITISVSAQDRFIINGQVAGMDNGIEISITRDFYENIDASEITDNKFILEGELQSPVEMLYLKISKDGRMISLREIWLEAGITIISGKNKILKLWDITNNVKEQQELNLYTKASYNDMLKVYENNEKTKDLTLGLNNNDLTKEEKEKIETEINTIRNQNLLFYKDAIIKEMEVMETREISDISISKLSDLAMGLEDYQDDKLFVNKIYSLWDKMSDEQQNSATAKGARSSIAINKLIGQPIIDVELKDLDGNTHKLSDFWGKYILIDFWNSGCKPCFVAFPKIQETAKKYQDKLTVININLDGDYERWKNASEKHNITWTNLSEGLNISSNNGFHATYQCRGIPYYLLISPEGTLMSVRTGDIPDLNNLE